MWDHCVQLDLLGWTGFASSSESFFSSERDGGRAQSGGSQSETRSTPCQRLSGDHPDHQLILSPAGPVATPQRFKSDTHLTDLHFWNISKSFHMRIFCSPFLGSFPVLHHLLSFSRSPQLCWFYIYGSGLLIRNLLLELQKEINGSWLQRRLTHDGNVGAVGKC